MKTNKYRNIEYSLVNISSFGEDLRMDAEYFSPYAINYINLISEKDYIDLGNSDIEIKGGNAFLSEGFNLVDGIPCARITEVNQNTPINEWIKLKYNIFNSYDKKYLKKFDILLGGTHHNAWDLGKVFLIYSEDEITFNQRVFKIRSNHKSLKQLYLYIALQTKGLRAQIEREGRGNNQLNLNTPEIARIILPIPSSDFQQKIEELVVKSYEEKEKSESLYKEAENILLKELNLLGFQPSTKEFNLFHQLFTIENNSSIIKHSDLIDTDRLDAEYWDSKYLEIQSKIDGITTKKLGVLVDYKKGIEVGTKKYIEDSEIEFIEDKKYFIRVSNISKQGLSFGSPKYITKETFEDLNNYKPKQGEILFSKDGTAGISYLLREDVDGIISGGILRLQNKSDIQTEYLELVLNSILIQSEIEKTTNGALIQHLKIEDALNFNIPIISEGKRNEISDKIQQSFIAKEQSKKLLEVAKRGVEVYIEETEEKGLEYIESNI